MKESVFISVVGPMQVNVFFLVKAVHCADENKEGLGEQQPEVRRYSSRQRAEGAFRGASAFCC